MGVMDLPDNQLQEAASKGVSGAHAEMEDRRRRRQEAAQQQGRGGSSSSSDADLGCLLTMLIPALVIYFVVQAIASGLTSLANESILSSLFPRPGDSVARFVVSLLTLELLLPGGLVLAARSLRGTRLHVLRRTVLLPLAIVLVPALSVVCVWTVTTGAVRLAS